jgi:hypothetical protein
MQSLASEILEALRERVAFGVLRAGVRLFPARFREELEHELDLFEVHVEAEHEREDVHERSLWCSHGRAIGCHPWPPFDEVEPCTDCSRSFGRGKRDVSEERVS